MNKEIEKILKINVPSSQLHCYKKYIKSKVDNMVGNIFSEGILTNINKIKSIKTLSLYDQEFSGSVVFEVILINEYYNPSNDDIITAIVIQVDEISVAKNDYAMIIFEHEGNTSVEVGDTVNIKIISKNMKTGEKFIKIYGKKV